MKTFAAALLVASAIALPAFAAEDHAPKHGGVVVETKAGDMELVAKPEQKPKPGSTAKRKLLPASTPPMSAVSARNKPGAARCPMWRNARAVGQICPDSGQKRKLSPPRPHYEIFVV